MKTTRILFMGLLLYTSISEGTHYRSLEELHQQIKTIYLSLGDHYESLFKEEFCHTVKQIAQKEGIEVSFTDEQLMKYASLLSNPAYTNLKGAEEYFIETFNKRFLWIYAIVYIWSNRPDNVQRIGYTLILGHTLSWIFNKLDSFLKNKEPK